MNQVMEPFAPLFDVQRDLGRLVAGGTAGFLPPADIRVTDEDVTVRMDVPGVASEQLEIELQDDVLTIRGERAKPHLSESGRGSWHRVERGFGRFERMFRLPKGLDPEAIEASLADGVLTLQVPKPEPLKPRKISISAASEARELEEVVN